MPHPGCPLFSGIVTLVTVVTLAGHPIAQELETRDTFVHSLYPTSVTTVTTVTASTFLLLFLHFQVTPTQITPTQV